MNRILPCLLALAACAAAAEPAPSPCGDADAIRFRGATARVENDLFVNTDRNYTSGVSLTFISRDIPGEVRPACLPGLLRLHAALIERFDPAFWRDGADGLRSQNVALRAGQAMYTPGDARRSDLIADDRPYAGLLYVGLAWNRRTLDRWRGIETLDTREVTLGVIGPLSLARQAQDLVHDLRGFERHRGWRHQLQTEPALQVARERKYRDYAGPFAATPGLSADSIRAWGLTLGNIQTSAHAAIEWRLGWNLPNDFGTYPIRPGAENRAPAPAASIGEAGRRPGVHLFAALEGRVVAHDFSLDGNLLRDSHRVTREPLVLQAAFGIAAHAVIGGHPVRFAVMRVSRSREFTGQGRRHAFGSIALSVDF